MTPRQSFSALAVAIASGQLASPECRQATCRAAGKGEQSLQLTVARLIARRSAYEGIQVLINEYADVQQGLATIEAKGVNVSASDRALHDRFKAVAAGMQPAYDEGRQFLYDSADLQLREDAAFAAGRLDAVRTMREVLASMGHELSAEAAEIEQRLAGEHQAKLALVYEWQNAEPF